MSKKYLITGGTGFIGAVLVKRLAREGQAVRVLDNNFRGSISRLKDVMDNIEFIEADVRSPDAVNKAVKGMDCVVHLAGINGTDFFYNNPDLVLDVSVRGMINIIDSCRTNRVDGLVFASSSEVYQESGYFPTDEKVALSIPDVLNPRYSYAGGKIIGELITINYGRIGFKRVTIFRPHNVYGPDMGWEHVLPQFILRAIDIIAVTPCGPIPFTIQGDGTQTRAFIYIDDFIEGLMCVINKGEHLNIYNIGNPEELTIREVAEKVVKYFGRQVHIIEGSLRQGSPKRRCPDISKLRALGFNPRISFDEGLPSTVEWYRANAHLCPKKEL